MLRPARRMHMIIDLKYRSADKYWEEKWQSFVR